MTNEITSYKKQFMLMTFSGMNYIIDEDQEKILRPLPRGVNVVINGGTVNTSNISGVPPLDVYYQQHPEERPAPQVETFKPPVKILYGLARYIHALESMVIGLNQAVTEQGYPISAAQQKIMDKIVNRIELSKKETDETFKPKPFAFAGLMSD